MTGRATSAFGQLTQGARPKKRAPLQTGRHTKLTPELSKRICDAVRAGNFVSVAARYAGVSEYTVQQWIARGRGEHPDRLPSKEFVAFVHDLDEAEAAAEVAAVLHWRAAMPKDWHSSEKWLKTKYPQRWEEKPLDQQRVGAFAGVNIAIGAGIGANVSESSNQGIAAPLEHLLEDNPTLIAGTMQILDQFLPIGSNSSEMPQLGTPDAQSDSIPGEFTEIDPRNASETQNGAFHTESSGIDPHSSESASESEFWGNSDQIDPESDG